MTALRLIGLGFGMVALLLVLLSAVMALKLWPIGADVPLLKTSDWEGKYIHDLYRGDFMNRRETVDGNALLLKRDDLETVYRYDINTRSLSAVTDKEWVNASGPISRCSGLGSTPPTAPVHFDGPNFKVFIRDQPVATTGRIALDYLVSPTGNWVAILSATGPVIPTLLYDTGRVLGQRYHEVVAVVDAATTGKPIRIPIISTTGVQLPCWSADENFVVYTDPNFSSLVVVETSLPPNQKR